MGSRTTDVTIVGAGVVGCSIAHVLSQRGLRVTVLDGGAVPGSGSTSYSSAIVRFNYSTAEGVLTSWESHHRWKEWREHLQAPSNEAIAQYAQIGGVVLQPYEGSDEGTVRLLRHAGIAHEMWRPGDIRANLPALSTGRHGPPSAVLDDRFWADPVGDVSGCYTPDAGYVDDAQLATQNLAAAARRNGTQFVFKTKVESVIRHGDRVQGVIADSGDRYLSPIVINAAGPHSSYLNGLAKVLEDFSVSTRPLRQEVHVVPTVSGYHAGSPFVADPDLGIYFRPQRGGTILVGGLEPECDPLDWVDEPDTYDHHPTVDSWTAQVYRLARRLPDLGVPHQPRGVAGLYDVTEDWIPIYDRTCLDGFYVAAGTSGNQFKNAPVVGLLMAELVEACENGHDHDGTPVHVNLPHSGRSISLGHYSRRRQITATSFSVIA